ncbi:hypothetical protein ACPA2L_30945 [Bacillus bombysepticus]
MIKERYQIRSSTQLKNQVKKYKECGEITDNRGKNSGMKGISNPLKGVPPHAHQLKGEINEPSFSQVKTFLKSSTLIIINS